MKYNTVFNLVFIIVVLVIGTTAYAKYQQAKIYAQIKYEAVNGDTIKVITDESDPQYRVKILDGEGNLILGTSDGKYKIGNTEYTLVKGSLVSNADVMILVDKYSYYIIIGAMLLAWLLYHIYCKKTLGAIDN